MEGIRTAKRLETLNWIVKVVRRNKKDLFYTSTADSFTKVMDISGLALSPLLTQVGAGVGVGKTAGAVTGTGTGAGA